MTRMDTHDVMLSLPKAFLIRENSCDSWSKKTIGTLNSFISGFRAPSWFGRYYRGYRPEKQLARYRTLQVLPIILGAD